jgi:beta-mannosidase
MKNLFYIFLSIPFLFSCNTQSTKQRKQIQITQNWQFKALDDSTWLNAKVPGVIHLDLLENGIIPNPFDSTNEQQLQWIGEKNWEYKLVFNSDTLPSYKSVDLIFDGLDIYTDVYLNNILLLQADNMYRTWSIPVKDNIQKGENILKIIFKSPEKINREKASQLTYKLPDERAFSRKAPYQFGWDWGAKFLTTGIWKSVYFDFWDDVKLSDIQIVQNNIDTNIANITANININSKENKNYKLRVFSSDSLISENELYLEKGTKQYKVDFDIKNPKLWWCNGMGDPNLYNLKFELVKNNEIGDKKIETIGIRTIELVQENDSIGKSFYFKLNGKPVFVKGANFVPVDNFLPRVTKNDYEKLINNAVWANFNMLRVWGGGIYKNDDFYNLCDKNGILVWQDFMFACNLYPSDSSFIENIKQEAIDNIIRLRNHPSLALWCGNNEIANAWNDWGWQMQFNYSKQDSTKIWNNYIHIFENLLPNFVEKYDGIRSYHASSPTYGWGHEESLTHGDNHYWGVWWGHEFFDVYNKKVGRFMSEYGFQALPNIKSIDQFANKDEQFIGSETMKIHQKHPIGYQTIDEYLCRYYKSTNNFDDYTYLSQLTQAEGITEAIEAHRRAKPICMGTLYWQFNDAWLVTSWSSVDYFGRRKALHYFVKQAYKPIIISTIEENNNINIYVISDELDTKKLQLKISYKDCYGKTIFSEIKQFSINNNSIITYQLSKNKFNDLKNNYLYSELYNVDELIDNDYYYFGKPMDLNLPKANINFLIKKEKPYYKIILQSDVLTKNIEVISNLDGEFSDNYFDLSPDATKEIKFFASENGNLEITFRCLNNLYK